MLPILTASGFNAMAAQHKLVQCYMFKYNESQILYKQIRNYLAKVKGAKKKFSNKHFWKFQKKPTSMYRVIISVLFRFLCFNSLCGCVQYNAGANPFLDKK